MSRFSCFVMLTVLVLSLALVVAVAPISGFHVNTWADDVSDVGDPLDPADDESFTPTPSEDVPPTPTEDVTPTPSEGYDNAHAFKQDVLETRKKVSRWDVYIDKATGQLWLQTKDGKSYEPTGFKKPGWS